MRFTFSGRLLIAIGVISSCLNPSLATAATIRTPLKLPADIVLKPGVGSFTDSKGSVWKIDSYQYALRNSFGVAGVPWPENPWQTNTLVYRQIDKRVYMWGSDSKWYLFDDVKRLFDVTTVVPLAVNPSAFSPLAGPAPLFPDVVVSPGSGSFTDSKGAVWSLDSYQYIRRNNYGVAGVPWPGSPWQSNNLIYRQADKRVYMWGTDSKWYYYDDAQGLFAVSTLSPVATNPAAYLPVTGPAPTLQSSTSPTPVPIGFMPPGRVVTVASCNGNATNDTTVVNNAGVSAGAGNTVQFANGQRCVLNTLTLTAGVYYYVPNGQTATLVAAASGAQLIFRNNVTFNGLSVCGSRIIADNTSGVTIGNSNLGSASCQIDMMIMNGTSGLTLINNKIMNTMSMFLESYNSTGFNIDGNIFDGCKADCIGMPYGAGNNSFIQRNVFVNTYKAVMEIGFAATTQATTNFKVINNWSSQSRAPAAFENGWGYQLAYSIPLNGAGSHSNVIANNYADGMTPEGVGDICIEISGSATVANNQCANFEFGALGYGACSNTQIFSSNNFSGTLYGTTVSYGGCSGSSFQVSGTTTNLLAVPAKPARVSWGGRN